jgi:hypothetical protein
VGLWGDEEKVSVKGREHKGWWAQRDGQSQTPWGFVSYVRSTDLPKTFLLFSHCWNPQKRFGEPKSWRQMKSVTLPLTISSQLPSKAEVTAWGGGGWRRAAISTKASGSLSTSSTRSALPQSPASFGKMSSHRHKCSKKTDLSLDVRMSKSALNPQMVCMGHILFPYMKLTTVTFWDVRDGWIQQLTRMLMSHAFLLRFLGKR